VITRKERKTVKQEIEKGKLEQASAAIEADHRELRFPTFGFNRRKGRLGTKIILVMLLVILILIAGIVGLWKFAFPHDSVMKKSAYIEQMKDLSTLATSQAYLKVILEKEDNEIFGKEIEANIPGTKRKLLLVVPGTITAGVDLSHLTKEQVKIDEKNKTIRMIIPKATFLQNPSVDFEEVETYSVTGIFRSDVKWEEAYELMDEAKESMEQEAIAQGILEKAEENAKKTIEDFYEQLGYSVNLTYESN